MISSSILPVAPPFAGRFDFQIAGVSAARMSSKSPPLFTLSGANSAMSTGPAQSSRCLIEQPAAPFAVRRPFRAHEHPRAFQLVAVERELEVPFLERGIDVVDFGRPRAAVPQHHDARAVAFRNHAFEFAVLDRMIFDVHRETLRAWDRATDLWARPTTAARRCVRDGSRSEDGWRDVSARRRNASDFFAADLRTAAGEPAGSGVF